MTEETTNKQTQETKETQNVQETMEDYKEELEASYKVIREGDILTGTVIDVSETSVVNYGEEN